MQDTKIRWTGATWNPMSGCTQISPGCAHCYAKRIAEKMGPPAFPVGFTPTFKPQKLGEPGKLKEPQRVFVNSMSDLFHEAFTAEQIGQVFDTMIASPRHTYQVLTKRPERMRDFVRDWLVAHNLCMVPPHIWLGTSIENDRYVWRANVLREIPVAVRFISAEPLLGPLPSLDLAGIAWLIVGGESGPGFRQMDHAWARDLRDRAQAAGAAFFFKQSAGYRTELGIELDGRRYEQYPEVPHDHAALRPETARGPVSQTSASQGSLF